MLRLVDILEKVSNYRPDADLDIVKKAYVYSAKVHQGQVRKSGEPYLVHPLAVAGILADLRLDEASIVAGLLHDTVEDTLATLAEVEDLFGKEVASIVDGVTKLSQFSENRQPTAEEKQAENFRKMIVAMARDIRVILVKLADRTHNMRTLEHMKPEKQERIARETLEIYAPIAHRLGIQWVKIELEDLAFKYLRPQDHADLVDKISTKRREHEKYIDEVIAILKGKLAAQGIPGVVTGRLKHLYSIYRKMRTNNIEFEQVHDIIAFRIVTENISRCYEALGLVHSLWKPVPGRFKDFIAIPKPNMYQSLHTTVIGPYGERVEIQIRTEEMHQVAEEGIAAHWSYKEGQVKADSADRPGLRLAAPAPRVAAGPQGPQGVPGDGEGRPLLRRGLRVHPHRRRAQLPPRRHPGGLRLRHPLRGRDPLRRGQGQQPDRAAALQAEERRHPRDPHLAPRPSVQGLAHLRQDQPGPDQDPQLHPQAAAGAVAGHRPRGPGEGAQEVRALPQPPDEGWGAQARHRGAAVPDPRGHDLGARLRQAHPGPDPLQGGAPPRSSRDQHVDKKGEGRLQQIFKKVARTSKSGISIQGIDDVLVRFGRCCNPVPGDPIVGFITRGRGVTVHTAACEKVLQTDPERRVDVAWDLRGGTARPVSLRVLTADRPGILAELSKCFSTSGVNIAQANCRSTGDDRAVNTFEVSVSDLKQLQGVIRHLERVKGVYSVERV